MFTRLQMSDRRIIMDVARRLHKNNGEFNLTVMVPINADRGMNGERPGGFDETA